MAHIPHKLCNGYSVLRGGATTPFLQFAAPGGCTELAVDSKICWNIGGRSFKGASGLI